VSQIETCETEIAKAEQILEGVAIQKQAILDKWLKD